MKVITSQNLKESFMQAIKSCLDKIIIFIKRDTILQLRSLADLINISLTQTLISILLAFLQTNQDFNQKGLLAVFFASLITLYFFAILLNLDNFHKIDYKTEWLSKVISSDNVLLYFFSKNITLIVIYFSTILPNILLLLLITEIPAQEIYRYMLIVFALSFIFVSLLSFVAIIIIKYRQTSLLTIIIIPFLLPIIMSSLVYVIDDRISALRVVCYLAISLFVLTPFINRYIFLEK